MPGICNSKLRRALTVFGSVATIAFMMLLAGKPAAQAQSADNELLEQLLAHPSANKGTVTFPIVFCWYKGQPALYIQTDASDPSVAAAQKVNLVPRLSNAIRAPNGGAVDDIYSVTNFKQGNVIPSAPIPAGPKNSDPNYTPLWQLTLVTWNSGATPRILKSEEDVFAARDSGEVSLNKTDIVLNCPVIYTPQGGKLPLIKIRLDRGGEGSDARE